MSVKATVRVHAIFTVPTSLTRADIDGLVGVMNAVYANTNIEFHVDSVESAQDPRLVKDQGPTIPTGPAPYLIELTREERALWYPGRLVFYLRPYVGSSSELKSYNYSSAASNYIVLGYNEPTPQLAANSVAHEVGHYFGAGHTFDDGHTNELAKVNKELGYPAALERAREIVAASPNGIACFDGDYPAVTDTPPDPGPPLFQLSRDANGDPIDGEQCTSTWPLVLPSTPSGAIQLAPDRTNIMSYFGCDPAHFSPDQARIVRGTLDFGKARHLYQGVSYEPPALTSIGSQLHLFARGTDRNIWHNVGVGDTWTGWSADIGIGTFSSGPAAACLGPEVHAFARGDDRNIWHNSVHLNDTWRGWSADLGVGTFSSGPAAVQIGASIHLFARGDDLNMWHNWWDGQTWNGWVADIGLGTFTSGSAAAEFRTAIHVFARGDDRNMWHNWWDGQKWSGWVSDMGAGTFTSGPAAVEIGGALHVFARGDDRDMWHNWWDSGVWHGWTNDIGRGTFTSAPAAVNVVDIHLIAGGDDMSVWHNWWNGQAWLGWRTDIGSGTFMF